MAMSTFGAAVTGWGLLSLAFLLIPPLQQCWASWDWVTSACEDLATKESLGAHYFFFLGEISKGEGSSVSGRLNFTTLQSPLPTQSSSASSMQELPFHRAFPFL